MKHEAYETIFVHEARHWWYRVRRTIAVRIVRRVSNGDKRAKVLDVGCGTGALLKELAKFVDVTGVDMSEEAVQYCRQRGIANVHCGMLPGLPFADQSYDIILALDVLEHVENHDAAMAELRRVLKPGGTLLILVPAFGLLWGSADVVGQHFRRYTKKTLYPVVERNGLRIQRSSYFNTFLFVPILLVRYITKTFTLNLVNELKPGIGPINAVLYAVFYIESLLLRYVSFPFGVSLMVIATREPKTDTP